MLCIRLDRLFFTVLNTITLFPLDYSSVQLFFIMDILTYAERKDLINRVAALTLGEPTRLRNWLPAEHFLSIGTDKIPLNYGFNVVAYCERKAWIATPGLLIRLLQVWKAELGINQLITRLQALQPPQYHPSNRPWDTCLVHIEIPWISRDVTRQAIEGFGYPLHPNPFQPGVRVLVVSGPAQSGKTYTCEFLRYIRAMFGPGEFELATLDYKNVPVAGFGPKELIGLLMDQVNPQWQLQHGSNPLPDLSNQQPAHWVRELCKRLRDEVVRSETTWCFVLDGFDAPNVPQLVLQCIQYFVSLCAGREDFEPEKDLLRLVLLGFNESIPDYGKRVRIDLLKDPGPADIRAYFCCYAAYRGVEIPPEALDDLVALVLDDQQELHDPQNGTGMLEQPSPSRMYRIAQKASLIARTVIRQELAS